MRRGGRRHKRTLHARATKLENWCAINLAILKKKPNTAKTYIPTRHNARTQKETNMKGGIIVVIIACAVHIAHAFPERFASNSRTRETYCHVSKQIQNDDSQTKKHVMSSTVWTNDCTDDCCFKDNPFPDGTYTPNKIYEITLKTPVGAQSLTGVTAGNIVQYLKAGHTHQPTHQGHCKENGPQAIAHATEFSWRAPQSGNVELGIACGTNYQSPVFAFNLDLTAEQTTASTTAPKTSTSTQAPSSYDTDSFSSYNTGTNTAAPSTTKSASTTSDSTSTAAPTTTTAPTTSDSTSTAAPTTTASATISHSHAETTSSSQQAVTTSSQEPTTQATDEMFKDKWPNSFFADKQRNPQTHCYLSPDYVQNKTELWAANTGTATSETTNNCKNEPNKCCIVLPDELKAGGKGYTPNKEYTIEYNTPDSEDVIVGADSGAHVTKAGNTGSCTNIRGQNSVTIPHKNGQNVETQQTFKWRAPVAQKGAVNIGIACSNANDNTLTDDQRFIIAYNTIVEECTTACSPQQPAAKAQEKETAADDTKKKDSSTGVIVGVIVAVVVVLTAAAFAVYTFVIKPKQAPGIAHYEELSTNLKNSMF